MGLCVNGKRGAIYCGSNLLYRAAVCGSWLCPGGSFVGGLIENENMWDYVGFNGIYRDNVSLRGARRIFVLTENANKSGENRGVFQ